MLGRTHKFLGPLFAIFCLLMSSTIYAKAILGVAPSSTVLRSITLAGNGSTTVTYSVLNNTNARTVKIVTIDPYYGIKGNPLTLTVQNNTCTGSLTPGASCSFSLLVKANGKTTGSLLEPRVCDYQSGTCSVPIDTNRISITAGGVAKSVAYIFNAGSNLLSICPINTNDGSLSTCTSSDGNGTFNFPSGLVVNSQATALFAANYGGTFVSICPILQDGTGNLGTCVNADGNGTFQQPDGVALNSAGTVLYVTSIATSTISICPVIPAGDTFTLGTCTTNDGNGTFNQIQTITINPDNTFVYVTNFNNTISICPVNHDSSIGTCAVAGGNGTFQFPQGLSFSPDNTYAYVGNYGNGSLAQSTVSVCPLLQNGSGGFGTCFVATGNTFNFTSNDIVGLYMASPTFFGYIPNNGTVGTNNNTVSICPINTVTHDLKTCSLFTDPTFNQPTSIALSFNITKG
jgi:DNA-binding beta-propeller fold protein YncE